MRATNGGSSTSGDGDAGDAGSSGTGGTMSAAQAGQGATDGGAAGTSSVMLDRAVCDAFAPVWRARAEATDNDCEFCLDYGCDYPRNGNCISGTDCVDRHCATLFSGAALCSCIESCFSAALESCNQRWLSFMSCAPDACAAACQLK